MRLIARIIYILYAYLAFAICGLSALAGAIVVPGLQRRRGIARLAARLFLLFARMPLTVEGLDSLPSGQCIIVANHASYLDGLVITAALPPRFSFVIKREMAHVPLAGPLLRRIGAEFIERFDHSRAARDARKLLRTAASGQSLVFFPEGTFEPQPGLLRFHTGAFHTAARAGCPVVPAVVRGTRRALPPDAFLPHAEPVAVELLPAIVPPSSSTQVAALELLERARAAILTRLHEPDRELA